MKAFFVSSAAFILLLTVILLNSIFVRRTADEVADMLSALPACEAAQQPFAELQSFWGAHEKQIALSTSQTDIEAINVQLVRIGIAIQANDARSFEYARALAIEAIEALRRSEELSVENLL